MHQTTRRKLSAAVMVAALLGGCAGPSRERLVDIPDTLEPFNRNVLALNVAVTNGVVRPIGAVYVTVVPPFARDRITAGVRNLEEPRIFVNDVLQGRPDAAAITFARFAFNSTLGIGGLFDFAATAGLKRQTGDFGQTLYTYGFNAGPYVVLPFLGPSTFRDGLGKGVDLGADPSTLAISGFFGSAPTFGIAAAGYLGQVGEFGDLEAGSVDLYARLKSTYLQNRAGELGQPIVPAELAVAPAPDAPRARVARRHRKPRA